MFEIIPIQSLGVATDSSRFLERNAVLSQVANGFARVPRKYINVYTLIKRRRQAGFAFNNYKGPIATSPDISCATATRSASSADARNRRTYCLRNRAGAEIISLSWRNGVIPGPRHRHG